LAISLGGDSDTIAAMTGSLAEARWGIPQKLRQAALAYLPEPLAHIVSDFEALYPPKTL
jgi:ADP-ribosylglycohydrolase